MMTKQQFEKAAGVVFAFKKNVRVVLLDNGPTLIDAHANRADVEQWVEAVSHLLTHRLIIHLSAWFELENPNFDRARFEKACAEPPVR